MLRVCIARGENVRRIRRSFAALVLLLAALLQLSVYNVNIVVAVEFRSIRSEYS